MHALDSQGRQVSLADINALTAATFGLTANAFRSNRRDGLLVRARWIAMWLAQHLTDSTLTETGRAMGQRDHTTILHGRRRACVLADRRDGAFRCIAHALRNALQGDTTMTDETTASTLRWITAALRDRRLTSTERLVLAELRTRAHAQTSLTITIANVAGALDISTRSVLTALREMTALRILDAILPHNGSDEEREIIVQFRLGVEG